MAEDGETTPLLENDAQDAGPAGPIGLFRKCASELLATALFVFIGTVSVATGNNLLIAIAHGLTITLLITAFGDISGGHINPVVTLGLWVGAGALPILSVFLYIVSQLIGAVIGALLTKVVLSYDIAVADQNHTTTVYESIRGGSHVLAEGVGPIQAIVFEVILTFILVFTVLMVAVEKTSHRNLAPLSIGLAVLVDIAVACNITGGSMNPARSFGPAAVIANLDRGVLTYHYVYWAGPIIGSLIAAVLYRLIFAGPARRIIGRK